MFTTPSRKIPKNYRNITGKFSSKKSDTLISYESKLERDFLYLFELSNYVLRIVEQPITIRYESENGINKYTPDFYLKTPLGYNDIIVEVKYHNELKETLPKSKHKYREFQKYLQNKNIDFYFYTDRCRYIKSEEYKFNTHFLINYDYLPDKDIDIIQSLFAANISIQELLDEYSDCKYKQLSLLESIWCMIRRNIIKVNLYRKLTLETELLGLNSYDEELYKAHLEGKIEKGYLL